MHWILRRMKVRAPSPQPSLKRGINQVYEQVRSHSRNLSRFEQWYEIKLEEVATICKELWLIEELLLQSPVGDVQHSYAPLILAGIYSKASKKILDMVARADPCVDLDLEERERTNQILSPLADVMHLAARNSLLINDNSKIAQGEAEYADLTHEERNQAQEQQSRYIMNFFWSTQDELVNDPEKALMDGIAVRLAGIAAKKTPIKVPSRRVSFKMPRLSLKHKDVSPNAVPGEFIRKVARRQALLIEQIEENQDKFECFFLRENESVHLCTRDHPQPSKLLKILYRQLCDIIWEKFQGDFSQTAFHLKVTQKLRHHPNCMRLSCKALSELKTRYEAIKEVERDYLEILVSACNKSVQHTMEKFSNLCYCGNVFHIDITTGPYVTEVD